MSDVQTPSHDSGKRRVEFRHPISTFQEADSPTAGPGELPQPLEAATAVTQGYIATLHFGLQPFLTKLSRTCLVAYSAYHTHRLRTKEMSLQPPRIPSSVRKLKLVLQPLDELKESEGYKALQSGLDARMELIHRELTDEFLKPLHTMNTEALLRRFHISVCRLLRNAANAFIAQMDLTSKYTADQAIIDLLAHSPGDLLSFPLPTNLPELLQLYKEANSEIHRLPFPSNDDAEIKNLVDIVNNTIQTGYNAKKSPSSTLTTSNARSSSSNASIAVQLSEHGQLLHAASSVNQVTPAPTITDEPEEEEDTSRISTHDQPAAPTAQNNTSEASHTANATTTGIQRSSVANPYHTTARLPNLTTPGTQTQSVQTSNSTLLPPRPTTQQMTRPEGLPPSTNPPTNAPGTSTQQLSTPMTGDGLTSPDALGGQTPHDPYDSPTFDFTSQELTDEDLESCKLLEHQNKLWKMIHKLYVNTIKLPLQEFHSVVFKREELQRIRQITTPALQSCLSAKVAATIQAERPADRPVLQGLIREETEKATAVLRQQLKSTTDTLNNIRHKHATLMHHGNTPKSYHHPNQHPRGSKNYTGGNKQRHHSGKPNDHSVTVGKTSSTVAAVTSPSVPQQTMTNSLHPLPQSQSDSGWGRKRPSFHTLSASAQQSQQSLRPLPPPHTDTGWGRQRPSFQTRTDSSQQSQHQETATSQAPAVSKINDANSATAEGNAISGRKRKNTKSWSRSKSQRNKRN